ncbi:MAG: hypothetical protein NC311_11565 [Muribaculaceae bacterium]|nr:hypothetical protein [Muribaculaceae bacterium]
MTNGELVSQYNSDLEELRRHTLGFGWSETAARHLRKHSKSERTVLTRMFTTGRRNTYLGLLIYDRTGTGKNRSWELSSFHVGLMSTSKGVCAIMFCEEGRRALKLTPHFFNRYKERFSEVTDWKTRNSLNAAKNVTDIIPVFLSRNPHMTWIETKAVFRDKVVQPSAIAGDR